MLKIVPLRELVPDDAEYWYYDEENNLVLRNDSEYGWLACTSKDTVQKHHDELSKVREQIGEVEKLSSPPVYDE